MRGQFFQWITTCNCVFQEKSCDARFQEEHLQDSPQEISSKLIGEKIVANTYNCLLSRLYLRSRLPHEVHAINGQTLL